MNSLKGDKNINRANENGLEVKKKWLYHRMIKSQSMWITI